MDFDFDGGMCDELGAVFEQALTAENTNSDKSLY
jgi:hypothetical protein